MPEPVSGLSFHTPGKDRDGQQGRRKDKECKEEGKRDNDLVLDPHAFLLAYKSLCCPVVLSSRVVQSLQFPHWKFIIISCHHEEAKTTKNIGEVFIRRKNALLKMGDLSYRHILSGTFRICLQ